MHTVTLEQAKEQLAELVAEAGRGTEVLITKDNEPVAKLAPISPRKPHGLLSNGEFPLCGLLQDKVILRAGWEETPEGFEPYLE
ncbi:MAG: type II toxin-antitoxin system prevent-host-death family antitoxin [Chthoniobacterales bacterium]|nr:type II toxin-antitoxin system prevent-host-death family antitoxin [Chthoniobacterales bacterium]